MFNETFGSHEPRLEEDKKRALLTKLGELRLQLQRAQDPWPFQQLRLRFSEEVCKEWERARDSVVAELKEEIDQLAQELHSDGSAAQGRPEK